MDRLTAGRGGALLRLFLPFAAGYFLSYFYRTANAVVGPLLSRELGLGAADLGLLTGAYFIAFAATQLPLGLLLDRFGPRRAESGLLLIAAAGAAVYGSSHSIGGLALGRALIGVGVSACLMAAFKAFSQHFPAERQASLTGWIMAAGTFGALVATAPLEAALRIAGWRDIFQGLAGLTLLVAGWILLAIPDRQAATRPESFAAQWQGLRGVLASRRFWRYVPLAFAHTGGFMALQSLWAGAWLIDVSGYTRAAAADCLAAMNLAMFCAYLAIGLVGTGLARRGVATGRLLGGGLLMATVALLLIVVEAPLSQYLMWAALAASASCGTLIYATVSAGFPAALSGRVNTAINLIAFVGAFALQWGIGLLIDAGQSLGQPPATAYRAAFAVLVALQAAAYAWFLLGGRRGGGGPAG